MIIVIYSRYSLYCYCEHRRGM